MKARTLPHFLFRKTKLLFLALLPKPRRISLQLSLCECFASAALLAATSLLTFHELLVHSFLYPNLAVRRQQSSDNDGRSTTPE